MVNINGIYLYKSKAMRAKSKSTIMKFISLVIYCLILQNYHSIGQNKVVPFPSQQKVTTFMNAEMAYSDLPAVVAMAINTNKQQLSYTYGKAIWTEKADVTTSNIFRIYAMTNLLTTIAAMQLVEKGMIGLDENLMYVLPEMTKIPILSDGKLSEAKTPITLRHLLTHTSGFGFTCTDLELSQFDYSKWQHMDLPRRFEAGTQFLYGSSFEWVGLLVAKLSGADLKTVFEKNITGPLKMNRTFFNIPDSLEDYVVTRGERGISGMEPLTAMTGRIPKDVSRYSGDDGLWSTPEDYMTLLKCILNYGTLGNVKILEKESVLEMTQNQVGEINIDSEGKYYNPEYCCNLKGLTSKTNKWGLGWLIHTQDKPFGRKAGTVLWGGMQNTYFFIDFKSGVAASIFTQHLPFNHPSTTGLFNKFSEIIYSEAK